ncbi:hypothetical protein ES288_D11G343100v1 [Gossypium darwinii]|uniref:F-box domain-containing protein n=1 Tax=Gossypium darwinii TaxID=34276 RepID=A0A5D2ASP9_GOSDA|nr:hypothetical protein ES288_D11G343100v1 [Gossypium darwinii]
MEEDDYDDGDGSYGEEEDDEKAGFMLKNDDFRPFTLFVNTVFVYCTMTSFLQPPEMGVDRISYLPKEVLCHILSFLPTKLTVRTSILSKNWRYLWDSVSALDFDDTLLFNPNKGGFHGIGGVNFINFVDRVLIRNSESPTHMFGLCCSRRHSFHLNAWINNAIKRKLRVLSLSLDKVKDYTLAIAPFASEILVNLFLSFAALEKLVIQECKLGKIWNLHVSAVELNSLIVVDAPKLEVLRYKGYVASGCSFENCISVARAVIDISDNGNRGMYL